MRVLFVGPFPWPSHQGSQAYLASQARALAGRGHDVHVLVYGAGEGGALEGVTLHRSARVPGGDFADGGMHASRPLHDLAMVHALRRLAREVRADLLHCHNVEGPLIAAAARTGLPVVYDLHTRMAEELRDHLPRGARWLGPLAGTAVDRAALAASDAGCAISDAALVAFERRGIPALRVGPSVDPAELVARPGAADRFPPGHVVYTGNLDRYQGLEALFEAARHFPLLVVTGSDGPVPPHVEVVRSPDFRDAIDALSTSPLAVIPRERCAGFPIKLLNQLGMGVPTVMLPSAAQALPGVLVVPRTRLATAIPRLLADPALRDHGARGRDHVLTHCTPDARGRQLERLYARVTGSGASSWPWPGSP